MNALAVAAWLACVPVPDDIATQQQGRPPTREEVRRRLEQAVQNPQSPLQTLVGEGVRAWVEAEDVPLSFPAPAANNQAQMNAFCATLENQQKQLSLIQYKLSVVADELRDQQNGLGKEPKHWQAAYHYVLAHLELRIAQLDEQNAMMGEMRRLQTPPQPKQKTWQLASSGQAFKDRVAAKQAMRARRELESFMQKAAGSDWERSAKSELKSFQTGYQWQAGRD